MDDLISRKAAMDAFMGKPFDYYHTSYIVGELNCIPSVPVVPLDKLCEWLEEQDYEIYCFMCQEAFDADGGCPNQVSDSQWRCGGKEHWKAFLKKVMEENGEKE